MHRLCLFVVLTAMANVLAGQPPVAKGACVIRLGGHVVAPETHAIVLPQKPTPQEEHAAADLNVHLGKLTGKTKLRARLVLARCLLENPNWVKRAEETLRTALEEQPESAEAYALLGELYAEQGLRARAAGMFRKVLDLRPGDRKTAEALARLEGRDGPDDEGGSGLLKKIFKR